VRSSLICCGDRIHADLAAEQTECLPERGRQLMRQIVLVVYQCKAWSMSAVGKRKT